MTPGDALEGLLANAALGALDGLSWPAALRAGAAVGDVVRMLGIRRKVAMANLALAFPERTPAEHAAILAAHYREVGRIAAEYGRMPRLVRAPDGEVMAGVDGLEALKAFTGRGVLMLSGHYGNFELAAAWLGRHHEVDFLVKPLSNPAVDARVERLRRDSGVGVISTRGGVKQVFRALRAGHWIAVAADQDAGRHGVFVPFFGRLASTAEGAARLALQTGAALTMGTMRRQADGRHHLTLTPPYVPGGEVTEENVLALTAWHTAILEQSVRAHPEHYFWLHRRWKTRPPQEAAARKDGHAPV